MSLYAPGVVVTVDKGTGTPNGVLCVSPWHKTFGLADEPTARWLFERAVRRVREEKR